MCCLLSSYFCMYLNLSIALPCIWLCPVQSSSGCKLRWVGGPRVRPCVPVDGFLHVNLPDASELACYARSIGPIPGKFWHITCLQGCVLSAFPYAADSIGAGHWLLQTLLFITTSVNYGYQCITDANIIISWLSSRDLVFVIVLKTSHLTS